MRPALAILAAPIGADMAPIIGGHTRLYPARLTDGPISGHTRPYSPYSDMSLGGSFFSVAEYGANMAASMARQTSRLHVAAAQIARSGALPSFGLTQQRLAHGGQARRDPKTLETKTMRDSIHISMSEPLRRAEVRPRLQKLSETTGLPVALVAARALLHGVTYIEADLRRVFPAAAASTAPSATSDSAAALTPEPEAQVISVRLRHVEDASGPVASATPHVATSTPCAPPIAPAVDMVPPSTTAADDGAPITIATAPEPPTEGEQTADTHCIAAGDNAPPTATWSTPGSAPAPAAVVQTPTATAAEPPIAAEQTAETKHASLASAIMDAEQQTTIVLAEQPALVPPTTSPTAAKTPTAPRAEQPDRVTAKVAAAALGYRDVGVFHSFVFRHKELRCHSRKVDGAVLWDLDGLRAAYEQNGWVPK